MKRTIFVFCLSLVLASFFSLGAHAQSAQPRSVISAMDNWKLLGTFPVSVKFKTKNPLQFRDLYFHAGTVASAIIGRREVREKPDGGVRGVRLQFLGGTEFVAAKLTDLKTNDKSAVLIDESGVPLHGTDLQFAYVSYKSDGTVFRVKVGLVASSDPSDPPIATRVFTLKVASDETKPSPKDPEKEE